MGCGPSRRRRCRRGEGQRGSPGRSCCCSRWGSRCGTGGKAGGDARAGGRAVILLRERGGVSIGGLVAVGREGRRRGAPRPDLSLGFETFRAVVLYCIAYRIVWFKERHQILTRLSAQIPGANSAARVYYRQKKRKSPLRYRKLHHGAAQVPAPLPPPPTCSNLDSPPYDAIVQFFQVFAKTALLKAEWCLVSEISPLNKITQRD